MADGEEDVDVERARAAAGGAEGLGLVGVSPLPSSPSPNQATCATRESQSLPSGEGWEDMCIVVGTMRGEKQRSERGQSG